ncbi:MAG: 1-acyl-sn-glycerol-3-phosphate acyltransferase [candidate division WOR-3 bacterium]|nr:MAG: 1-acyl-sn-glycerol-3-phosphate acyltransferase [candidate division WOR-3 bacterium]
MDYYRIACRYVTPIFRIVFNFKIIGGENLLRAAARGTVVVCTTHSSDLGGMIVGMAVSTVLKAKPWIVVNVKFRKNRLTHFFLKDMNIVWIAGNDMLGNYHALKKIRELIVKGGAEAIIMAPQGTYNKPVAGAVEFRQGFAIPCIKAANVGAKVIVVPAFDLGATYRSFPGMGRRIAAIFGCPIEVKKHAERAGLAKTVEKSVKNLITAYGTLF